jgi:hypothetical protein
LLLPNLIIDREKSIGKLNLDAVNEIFYEDCSEEDILLAREQLCAEPLLPFIDEVQLTRARFGQLPLIYIETTLDVAVSPRLQKEMYTNAGCENVFSLQSAHAPFFSQSAQLTAILTSL